MVQHQIFMNLCADHFWTLYFTTNESLFLISYSQKYLFNALQIHYLDIFLVIFLTFYTILALQNQQFCTRRSQQKIDFWRCNVDEFRNEWNMHCLSTNGSNVNCENFLRTQQHLLDEHARLKTLRKKISYLYKFAMDSTYIRKEMKERNKLFRKFYKVRHSYEILRHFI